MYNLKCVRYMMLRRQLGDVARRSSWAPKLLVLCLNSNWNTSSPRIVTTTELVWGEKRRLNVCKLTINIPGRPSAQKGLKNDIGQHVSLDFVSDGITCERLLRLLRGQLHTICFLPCPKLSEKVPYAHLDYQTGPLSSVILTSVTCFIKLVNWPVALSSNWDHDAIP